MQITWLGHAAFLIETDTEQGRVRIITDPYSSQTGYGPINEAANVVTLSHENPKYHSCLDELRREFEIVRGLEIVDQVIKVRGLRIGAVQVFENEQEEGPNTMLWLESRGLRVLHMGDVGHPLNDQHLAACGDVDILLAPTGGTPTITLPDLKSFIDRLRPSVVIPMHYGTSKVDMKILTIEHFITLFAQDQIQREDTATLTIPSPILTRHSDQPIIHVLQHAR